MKRTTAIVLILWISFGALAYAGTLADFTHHFPDQNHEGFAVYMGLMGPAGLVVTTLCTNFFEHGLRWKPLTREERWIEYHVMYPSNSRSEFERTR